MSSEAEVDTGQVEQSGWARLGHLVVQLSIVAGAAVALADGELSNGRKLVVGSLAAGLLGWHALMAYRWHYWDLTRIRFVGSTAVAALFWMPLLFLHSGFGITVLGAYAVAACPFLTRAAASVVALSAILLFVSAVDGGGLGLAEVAGVTLTGLAVIVVHGLVGRIHSQNQRQRELIGELQSTRDELANRERDAGALAERERLARDIHDSLAQGFTSIFMLLEAADAQLDPDAVDVRASIDQARQTARQNLAEARRVVWSLRPGPLERGALAGALEVLVESSFANCGVKAEFRVEGDPYPLLPEHEVVLFRSAQESLTNAAKHADASRVVCTLTFLDEEVILDMNDDGAGFDTRISVPGPDGGLGLIGLRERAGTVAGSVDIESDPSTGTNITVTIPTARTGDGDCVPEPKRTR
jgi:signal transduction histidine kinase